MGCDNGNGFVEGGTIKDANILNPTISGGTITGTHLKAVTFDTASINAILTAILPSIMEEVDRRIAAGGLKLKNCQGLEHPKDTLIPSCEEMECAITDALLNLEIDYASFAKVFNDCNGAARGPGVSIPSCEDVNDMIDDKLRTDVGVPPRVENEIGHTTKSYGDRSVVLCKPDSWRVLPGSGGLLVPAYRPGV